MSKKSILLFILPTLIIWIILFCMIFLNNTPFNKLRGLSNSSNVSINCDKTKVVVGDTVTCNIYLNAVEGKVSSFSANTVLSSNLSLVSSSYSSNFSEYSSSKDGKFMLSTRNLLEGRILVGSLGLKVNSAGASSVSLSSIVVGDENYDEINLPGTTSNLTILSTDSSLQTLTINDAKLSPAFNKDITNYTATTDASSVIINATAAIKGSVSGIGTKSLNYGNNIFNIVSYSESGSKKNYTVNIIRNDTRSSNNNLKELTVSNTNIKYNGSTNYSALVDYKVNSVQLFAKAFDSKAIVSGIGEKKLNIGKNAFNIIVTAENGLQKKYYVTIIRRDKQGKVNLSANNYLKILSVSGVNINFNKHNFNYTFNVKNEVEKLNINYILEDSKSKVDISNLDLKIGKNIIKVRVIAEDNSVRTYTLNVTRENKMFFVKNFSSNIKDKIEEKNNQDDIVINVKIDESKVVKKDILSKLKDSKKRLIYNVLDNDDSVIYTIIIDGNKINKIKDFNYELTFDTDKKDIINKKVLGRYLPLNFRFNDKLPGKIEVIINVKNKVNKTKLYNLYYYDNLDNKLKINTKKIGVVDDRINFDLDEFSLYLLIEENIEIKDSNPYSTIILISMVLLAIIGLSLFIFIVRTKPVKKGKIKFYRFRQINIRK